MTTSNRVVLLSGLIALGLNPIRGLSQSSEFRNSAVGIQYIGSKVCAACHPAIYLSYSKTAMGRSMASGDDASVQDLVPAPFTLFDNEAGEYFEVARKQDGLYQSQYAVNRSGKDIFRQTRKLAYVVGAGENGFGFIVERGGFLFEAPLTYYSKPRLWSFSPGYELRNLGFDRPILAECLGCHAGRPMPVYNRAGLYRHPPFAELAVGCENCHGPGGLHVAERQQKRQLTGRVDTSIVNPSHLSGWLSDNICMKCHQGGDFRVEQPGKQSQSFRPGTPLNLVLSIFKVPVSKDSEAQSPLLEHYFSMTLSKCFRSSAGQLRCASCHDPHTQPAAPEAVSYYRAKCLSCHQSASCKAPIEERAKTKPSDNCASCHMPSQTVTTITHAALTDHRITARANEPLPDVAFRANSDSGLIDLTAAPGERSRSDPITLLQAYASAIRDGHGEFKTKLNDLLDGLARDSPSDALVLSALGRRAMTIDTPEGSEQAIRYFSAAIRNDPAAYENFILLAKVYARTARHQEAVRILQEGMPVNSYVKEFPESLAVQYMELGEYGDASRIVRKGLEIFPDDLILRTLQKKISAATLDGSPVPEP